MTQLTLAKPEHLEVVARLVADYHAEAGIDLADEARREGIQPLLEGSPHGAIYLAGPARAPVGFVALTFGWSLALGGLDGLIDAIYIRSGVRGRGIGTEILSALPRQFAGFGLRALHMSVHSSNSRTKAFYARMGFKAQDDYELMTRKL